MIIKTNPDEFENYCIDSSNFKGTCDAVYFPENAGEIAAILKDANESRTKITIAGNGTGLTGARVPQGGIVIATDKLNKILKINEKEFYAIVEPAVLLSDLQSELKKLKLLYPPDPTETNCFIGGTVATNASGAKTFRYGPTRDYVLGLEIILPDGEEIYLERGVQKSADHNLEIKTAAGKIISLKIPDYNLPKVKNASGYYCKPDMDAIDLFIGSEGTLGVITKIKLKLLPLPEDTISCVLFFEEELNALNYLEQARSISYSNRDNNTLSNIDALALEYFDEGALKFLAKDFSSIPAEAKARLHRRFF
jgi:D-lactate dehydrogenase (cytochrome)